MADDIKWLMGLSVTILLAFGGVLFTAFRNLTGKIERGDDALHDRISQVKEDYVRRVDLDSHLGRLDKNVDDLRGEIRQSRAEMNQRLDALIAATAKRNEA